MRRIFGTMVLATILITSCNPHTDTTNIKSDTISRNSDTVAPTSGTVKGKLCYPSEHLPSLNVSVRDVNSANTYNLTTKENQMFFEFKNLPEGVYVSYAYHHFDSDTPGIEQQKLGGGYTYAVPCGLSVNCNDHRLIEFKVVNGKITDSINICDWYGAILPEEFNGSPRESSSNTELSIPDKRVEFGGISASVYSGPVLRSNGQYNAYFKNLGRSPQSGLIIISESNQTLKIRWTNGDEWIANIIKRETKTENDDFFGPVDKTIYNGIWTNNSFTCSLDVITKKNDGKCFFQLKSQKVTQPEYKIETWKKKYVFYTNEKCLE